MHHPAFSISWLTSFQPNQPRTIALPTTRPYWSKLKGLTLMFLPRMNDLSHAIASSPYGCAGFPKWALSGASIPQSLTWRVLCLSPLWLTLGSCLSHPQPPMIPPGVWKKWKLSPSPTDVTFPWSHCERNALWLMCVTCWIGRRKTV